MFQLRAGTFTSCEKWTVSIINDYDYDNYIDVHLQISTEDSIKSFFRSAVVDVVMENCDCGFLDSFITQEMLLCDAQNPTQAVYRAQVFNFGSISSTQIVSWIEDWVLNGASVTSGPILVIFDPTCPVHLDSNNDEICQLPATMFMSTHTTRTTSLRSTPTMVTTQSTSIGVIAGSVLVVGCIVFICVVVIIIVAFYFRLQLKKGRYEYRSL